MDWITGIQRTIDYIEENLTEPIDYGEISKIACSSYFHFQRVFGILCGCTLGEYIRARRLTLAGSELTSSNFKIIDVANKYCYNSTESFERAFKNFHGITPSQAKKDGNHLKAFSRLTVKLVIEGGNTLNYRIEKKEAFKIIEKVRLFTTEDERNIREIPAFWDELRRDGAIDTLFRYDSRTEFNHKILGICYENSYDGQYEFPYSIATGYSDGTIPKHFRVNDVESNTWAIFRCKGSMPDAIQNLWHRIYAEYFPTSNYKPKNEKDFEVYPEGDMSSSEYESEIWIAVEKR